MFLILINCCLKLVIKLMMIIRLIYLSWHVLLRFVSYLDRSRFSSGVNESLISSISAFLFSFLLLNFDSNIPNTSLILLLLSIVSRMAVISANVLQVSTEGLISNSLVALGIFSLRYFLTNIKSSVIGRSWTLSNLLSSRHLNDILLTFFSHSRLKIFENLSALVSNSSLFDLIAIPLTNSAHWSMSHFYRQRRLFKNWNSLSFFTFHGELTQDLYTINYCIKEGRIN